MWIGEQITEYGIGNGISLIIFAGIVAQLPGAIINTFRLMSAGQISFVCRPAAWLCLLQACWFSSSSWNVGNAGYLFSMPSGCLAEKCMVVKQRICR
jgi:hypothetical protein